VAERSSAKRRGESSRPAQARTSSKAAPTPRRGRAGGEARSTSPEAVALGVAVVGVAGLVVGYSGLFGTVGAGVFAVGRLLLGRAAWLGWIGLVVFGVHALARRERASRRIVGGIALAVVATSALVGEVAPLARARAPQFGGLVGGEVARALVGLEQRTGAVVTTVVLVVVGLALVAGLRWRILAEGIAERLRGQPEASAPEPSRASRRDRSSATRPSGDLSVIEPTFEELSAQSGSIRDDDVGPLLGPGSPIEGGVAGKDTGMLTASGEASPTTESPIAFVESASGPSVGDRVAGEWGSSRATWELPKRSVLRRGSKAALDRGELIRSGQVLQAALASHGVSVSLVGMTTGPTVTRYELELGEGVKVARVLALQRDIAYAMASADVRILAPIPGRSAIGIEVPNRVREVVTLGDVLGDVPASAPPLAVPLGRDIAGRTEVVDLAKMPHVLIAGTTGSGKSSLVNSILVSLLMRTTPDELRLILIDPKRVELSQYAGLPHLLTQVVVDPKRAAGVLAWAVAEMERRYDVLAQWGVRDLDGYRGLARLASAEGHEPGADAPELLPSILVVIDELHDLMMVAPRDVEDAICRIAQKARAVGIHLLVATQRPSVDVITGVIKTNIPARIAFAVASQTDSRVILDQPGAEKLVGKGDLLYVTAERSTAHRLQAPWVDEREIAQVVGAWRRQGRPQLVPELEAATPGSRESVVSEDDPLVAEAIRLVVESQIGSTSMLQRRLKVGFARAGRLMDLLEARGVVGPAEGSKARQVLVRPEELAEILGEPASQEPPRPFL
jgi:S-DNA-T family DNA segregation ATPase FtsK/SpoIIIE